MSKLYAKCPKCGVASTFVQLVGFSKVTYKENNSNSITYTPDTAPMIEELDSVMCLNCNTICTKKELTRDLDDQSYSYNIFNSFQQRKEQAAEENLVNTREEEPRKRGRKKTADLEAPTEE